MKTTSQILPVRAISIGKEKMNWIAHTGNTKPKFEILVMMSKMVLFHSLEVGRKAGVVQTVRFE